MVKIQMNNQQDFHYNNKISLFNITTNPGAYFYVSSNTEIELTTNMNLNNGTWAELYITPACAGGARMGNNNDSNPNPYYTSLGTEIVKRNDKSKNFNIDSSNENFIVKPNPSNGNFQLILSGDYELPNKIIIRDVLSNVITIIENPSLSTYEFNLLNEASGVYMLSVYFNNKVVNKRIIKQ